jgi:hypothetical protein
MPYGKSAFHPKIIPPGLLSFQNDAFLGAEEAAAGGMNRKNPKI